MRLNNIVLSLIFIAETTVIFSHADVSSFPFNDLTAGNVSLEDIVNRCYQTISMDYGNETLRYVEPIIAFLEGSYQQWMFEQSLTSGALLLQEDSLDTQFNRYSFNTTVLPSLTAHCGEVAPRLSLCLLEYFTEDERIHETGLIIDRLIGLSERYCEEDAIKSKVISDLLEDYVEIGNLFDVVWSDLSWNETREQLVNQCGDFTSTAFGLEQILGRSYDSYLSAIANIESFIITSLKCYVQTLVNEQLMSENNVELITDLVSLVMNIDKRDIELIETKDQYITTEMAPIDSETISTQSEQSSTISAQILRSTNDESEVTGVSSAEKLRVIKSLCALTLFYLAHS